MAELLIPYALDLLTRKPVQVDEVQRGKKANALCPNCQERVVAKQGKVKTHHFAHWQDNANCTPEGMLHGAAKWLLAHRVNAGGSLKITYPCADCSGSHTKLFERPSLRAVVERRLFSYPITPDVTVMDGSQPLVCCEIVVTHPPDYDPATMPAPVITISVKSVDDLLTIANGLIPVSKMWGVDLPPCPVSAYHRAIKVDAWKLLERMRHAEERSKAPLSPWHRDKYHSLKPATARQVHAKAQELLRRGFQQHNPEKPWSFRYKVPGGYIYALLTSTHVIPIWEGESPLFSVHWNRMPADSREDLLRNAIRRLAFHILANSSVGCRQSFYDHWDTDIQGLLAPDSEQGYFN